MTDTTSTPGLIKISIAQAGNGGYVVSDLHRYDMGRNGQAVAALPPPEDLRDWMAEQLNLNYSRGEQDRQAELPQRKTHCACR